MNLKWDNQPPLNFKKENKDIIDYKRLDFYKNVCLNTVNLSKIYEKLIEQDIYHTNSIEGSTITQSDTLRIIKDKFYNESKYHLNEIATVTGYKSALDFCFEQLLTKEDITEELICDIHFNLMSKTEGVDLGIYRYENTGTFFDNKPINYSDFTNVPEEMKQLVSRYKKYKNNNLEHPIETICNLKCDFIVTHPFVDGNGRVSRLLLNYALLKMGYLPVVIKVEEKEEYIETLEYFRTKGDPHKFINFIMRKLMKTYKHLHETEELKLL